MNHVVNSLSVNAQAMRIKRNRIASFQVINPVLLNIQVLLKVAQWRVTNISKKYITQHFSANCTTISVPNSMWILLRFYVLYRVNYTNIATNFKGNNFQVSTIYFQKSALISYKFRAWNYEIFFIISKYC